MLSLFVVTTLASLAATSPVLPNQTWPPSFCATLDCPKYTVVKNTTDYEERMYDAANWTSTKVSGTHLNLDSSIGFEKLRNYIHGENKEKVTIPMTAPVSTKVEPGEGKTNFTVSYFVPFADQTSPPEPTDPTVFINPLPQMTAFVSFFSGYASDKEWTTYAETLAKSLDNAAEKYHKEFFYTATYNSPWPFQPTNRHNEVWFIKSDKGGPNASP